jgi:hypothetical protein
VGTTGEIAFLEADIVEHSLHERDVLGLASVRRARHRQLRSFPPQLFEAAGGEERNYLKGLGAGSPEREGVAVAGSAKELIAFSDNGGMYSVFRFGALTAGDCNIELVRFDHTPRYPS